MTPFQAVIAVLFGTAIGLGASALIVGAARGAEVCQTPTDLYASLEKGDHQGAALYPFEGEDAAKLQTALEGWRGTPYDFKSPRIDTVLWLADGTVSFYVFDAVFCGKTEFIFEKSIAGDLMMKAGVVAPFGPTFYKLPGTRI